MKILQLLVLVFGFVVVAYSQNINLNGVVYDTNGAVVVGTKITVIDKNNFKYQTETNDEGKYKIGLPVGKYDIQFESNGFEKTDYQKITIVNSTYGELNLDVVLEVNNPEPCGYSGAECFPRHFIEPPETKVSDKILQKPLEASPKKQDKTKRKNKNNKQ